MIEVLCGIDVSSTSLQARIGADGAEAEFANSPQGVTRLACFCREHGVTLAVMEATGGYQRRPQNTKRSRGGGKTENSPTVSAFSTTRQLDSTDSHSTALRFGRDDGVGRL